MGESPFKEIRAKLKQERFDESLQTEQHLDYEKAGGQWPEYDSSFKTLEASFLRTLPERSQGLLDYVQTSLKGQEGSTKGLEVGGQGSKLFAGFPPGLFKQTLGVTLLDSRTREQKKIDDGNRHLVWAQDALSAESLSDIRDWLGQERAGFIIERMHGATATNLVDLEKPYPQDPVYLFAHLRKFYSLLAPNGSLFLQSPYIEQKNFSAYAAQLRDWEKFLTEKLSGAIEAQSNSVYGRIYLRIQKKQAGPDKLPGLPKD